MALSICCFMLLAAPQGTYRPDIEYLLPSKEVRDLFTPLEHRYTGGRYEDEVFYYRLFEPEQESTEKKYPLVVWLHGNGVIEFAGPLNRGHLTWLDLIIEQPNRKDYPFFLLAMQCPKDSRVWTVGSAGSDADTANDPMTVLVEIIDKAIEAYPIDPDRISLVGISAGGSGCWEMAMRYPRRFAAIAPLATGGGDESRAGLLKQTPVWAFHSKYDEDVSMEGTARMVDAVKRAGGNIHLTEIETVSHNCWSAAFGEYDLTSWLIAQRRSANDNPPPGTRSTQSAVLASPVLHGWQWWQPLLVIGVPVLVLIAWRGERRRRLKLAVEPPQLAEPPQLDGAGETQPDVSPVS